MTSTPPISPDAGRGSRVVEFLVGFRILAVAGALVAAITPAIVASRPTDAGGPTVLRGSISAYYDVGPWFWLPFGAAAVLLALDGLLSYRTTRGEANGRRWYNVVLGALLAVLTGFNLNDDRVLHYVGAIGFFVLFYLVIGYTTAIGLFGRPTGVGAPDVDTLRASGRVALALLVLGLSAIGFFAVGLISFFFFELHALVVFALFFVIRALDPFPFVGVEFPSDLLNRVARSLRIMRA